MPQTLSLSEQLRALQASGTQVHLLHALYPRPDHEWTCIIRGANPSGDKFEVTRSAPSPEAATQEAFEGASPYIAVARPQVEVYTLISGPPTLDSLQDDLPF